MDLKKFLILIGAGIYVLSPIDLLPLIPIDDIIVAIVSSIIVCSKNKKIEDKE